MLDNKDLTSFRFKTERGKTFFFDIKENENGKFVKITESRPRMKDGELESYIRNFMTIPEDSVIEFIEHLKHTLDYLKRSDGE